MQLQLLFQLLNQFRLLEHLTSEVVARGVHVVATGHRSHSQCHGTTAVVTMAQFAGTVQLGRIKLRDLQAAEFGVQADDRGAGQKDPDVVVGQA